MSDCGGVTFVPAFTGLFAPHWRADARGTICGLTRGTKSGHIARAALEATALQCRELVHAMAAESNTALFDLKLHVDGGMSVNNSLMQWQADLAEVSVHRPDITETTAAGAAFAAGLERNCFIYICNNFTTCCWKNPCPDKSSSWASSSVKRWEKGIQRSLPGAASDIL